MDKVRMIRVSESVWEKLMKMKLDLKKSSIDDLLAYILKQNEDKPSEESVVKEVKKEDKEKHLAGG